MSELRTLFSVQIVRGGLLRADGVGVGLVGGGAPPWELMSREARAQVGADYHRLLLALDAPLDVYLVDYPHDVSAELAQLAARRDRAADEGCALQAAVLGEIRGYLADLARHSDSRAKQVVWAVTSGPAPMRAAGGLAGLLRGEARPANAAPAGHAALRQAVERARRMADALAGLGGVPQPRLLEPEEIAGILYRQADPLRAQRYPLAGPLLERVARVVGHTAGRAL